MEIDKPQLPSVPGYKTEAILGQGGMATVYLAVQESLSRHVALKVMNRLLTGDADFCRRFLNEGRLIAKLSHPNIVTVYDIGASDDIHYLSMTYLPGGTLKDKIRDGLPLDRALYILKCLADALGYAHSRGIVHRDIKPGNVLFTESGTPILTDFGIAKTVDNETKLTSTGMMVGSIGYMSPEQTLGHEVDNRSDLYSLGVLFWEMLTGCLPYHAQDPFALALKHANDPLPELPARLHRFQPVIEGMLAKKPRDRLASAEELVRVIDEIPYGDISSSSPSDSDETIPFTRVPERTVAPKRRLGVVTALTTVAGLAAIAGYFGYSRLYSPPPDVQSTSTPPSVRKSSAGPTESVRPSPAATESPKKSVPSPSLPRPAVSESQAQRDSDAALSPNGKPPQAMPQAADQGDATRRIEKLLRRADGQWKAGRLTEPLGDNAFESYSRVLDLDPEHTEAKQRLVQIGRINAANRMFSSAEHLLRKGEIENARRMIETGLKINPEDKRLLGLQRALDY